MPRKKAPKARLSKDEKTRLKAAKKADKKDAKAATKAMLVEWCATPDAEFPRAE